MRGLSSFLWILRLAAAFIVFAGSLHIIFGLKGDLALGAGVSADTLIDPGLDSQNRFYGGIFLLYGVLLVLITSNLRKYETVLKCLLWVFLFAGSVRFISVALYGWPPMLIGLLFAAELVLPPILLIWLSLLRPVIHSAPSSPVESGNQM